MKINFAKALAKALEILAVILANAAMIILAGSLE